MMATPYLWTRDNPHAPQRANGRRFWGYPTRRGGTAAIRVIGLHTAETSPSPASAENVARWQRDDAPRPSSYHVLVDSDSEVLCLPDGATAFGIGGFNTPTLQLSWATRAGWWGRYPVWDEAALVRGAERAATWCRAYGIPVRLISAAQARAGHKGFVTHGSMDPFRRRDPGAGFPLLRFFSLVDDPYSEEEMQLKRGDDGRAVAAFQKALMVEADVAGRRNPLPGYGADSSFGPETEAAVKRYQQAAEVDRTGRVDGVTAALLARYITVDVG